MTINCRMAMRLCSSRHCMEVDAPVGISIAHGFWRILSIIPIQYYPRTFCHSRGLASMGKETTSKETSNAKLETVLDRFHTGIVFWSI